VPTPQDAVTFTRDMFRSQMETASQER